jgi:sulfite oxidase
VELSADGGFTWYEVPAENMSKKGRWTWRTWEIDLPCEVEGWIEIVCRCWDNSLNTQPLNIRAAWNWGLHVTSSAHRIKVYSINKSREITRKRLDKYDQMGVPLAPLTRYEIMPIQNADEYEVFWNTHDPRDVDD